MSTAAALALLASPADFAEHYSERRWRAWPYLRHVADAVADAVLSGGGQLLVSLPVRHGKSELISHWIPAWFLTLFPERNVLLASYSGELAEGFSRKTRNTLREIGTASLAEDSQAAHRWHTKSGGMMAAMGVGGTMTGRGGHLTIIDDPIKDAEEADSETIRRKQIDWFDSVVYTRREPGSVVVLLMARWHEGDLYGYLSTDPKHKGKWREIRLPALAEDNDALGRKPGEALNPERYTAQNLLETKSAIQPRWWQALYQQQPASAEGAEIKRHWWRWYDELPVKWDELDYRLVSVDATFRDTDGSDYVVIQTWGVYGAFRYLLDQVRERLGFVDTCKALESVVAKWRPMVVVVEGKANGDAIVDAMQHEIGKIDTLDPLGGKEARARSASGDIYTGNVLLPRTEWAAQLVEEAAAFPLGKHDDMVDAASMALIYLRHFYKPKASALLGPDRIMTEDTRRELERKGLLGGRALFSIRKDFRRAI